MAPSPTARRLLKETSELSTSAAKPAPAFHAQPVSDADLHEWHFTLLGPPSPSPYAGGLYHGRITLPPQYPLKPPNFRFLTPSGRFEVNREICLSISGFHEETWMPAWGIRTALTALRTFMAEPGTAGQVGGLEASAEVRKRMAQQSRSWRCETCGRRSNEEIMREWWQSCRERGVNVDEEGVDVGLEWLPEGLNLQARAPSDSSRPDSGLNPSKRPSDSGLPPPTTSSSSPNAEVQAVSAPAITVTNAPNDVPASASASAPISASTMQPAQSPTVAPLSSTPTPEQIQSRAEAVLTPSDQATTSPDRHHILGFHAGPLTAATRTAEQHQHQHQHQHQPRGHQHQSTLTIDRAIAGVFIALIVMLLKRVFYPARSPSADYVDGRGAYYLEREF